MNSRLVNSFVCGMIAIVLVACGGGATTPTDPPSGSLIPEPTAPPTGGTPTDQPGDFTPGPVRFRVVNLIGADSPLDVYVRTDGLVQAFSIQEGLAYGTATDYFAPPDQGSVVVTTAGAGDPECVASCPHIISSSSTSFGEGDTRTMVLYDGGTQELWHNPEPASVGTSGNALPPADPWVGLVFTVAVGLTNADFGVRLAFADVAGCQVNRVSESILVGGNQVGSFAVDGGSVSVNLHDQPDQECADPPVGGPFEVSAAPDERTMLVLYGEPGAMNALVLNV